MSFNSLILSIFASKTRFGCDMKSLQRRYQVLSIIYINFFVSFLITGYEIVVAILVWPPNPFHMTIMYSPLFLLTFIFVHYQKFDSAALALMVYMHLIDGVVSVTGKGPMTGVIGLMVIINSVFFLTSSQKVKYIETAVCIAQAMWETWLVHESFKVTLTEEQAYHIFSFKIGAFLCVLCTITTCTIQKAIENNLWQMIISGYEKSETLTKEAVQAAEAKDAFVSSLSHEIRNPLNALNGSIDYLLGVVKNTLHLKILQHAKLSSEILLNLVNNILDVAKLRSEKMEISFVEANFTDIIKKSFIINSENLRKNNITAKAYIDRLLPTPIVIDASRLLQIILNLLSNAIKFTPKGGKISIYAAWLPSTNDRENLLALINNESNDKRAGSFVDDSSKPLFSHPAREFKEDFIYGSKSLTSFDDWSPVESEHETIDLKFQRSAKIKLLDALNNSTCFSSPVENWDICSFTPKTRHTRSQSLTTSFYGSEMGQIPAKKGFLKIQVSDTGCGIPQDKLPRLFGMFEQAHKSVTTMHGGSGLGLFISRQLCQKMGGDIKIYSKVNEGTSFVFYIPVDNEHQFDSMALSTKSLHDTIHCMVVDDYSHNRDLHKLLLEREGASVTVASNGNEALEKYKQHQEPYFDFIMMDVLMPEMDGFTAARLIRQWEAEQKKGKVDIYFVSGEYFNEEEVLRDFKSKGGHNEISGIKCLKKPVDLEVMRRIVKRYKGL